MINTRKLYALFFCINIINSSLLSTSPNTQTLDFKLPSTDSKVQKARMRKRSNTPTTKIRSFRDMNYDQLSEAKKVLTQNNNNASAIKYLEQMNKLTDDTTKKGDNLLEIADLYFAEKQFQKSAQRYAEYALLYPGGKNIAHALAHAIKSSFNCQLSFDRDQTKTEETLALADSFLQQDHFTLYKDEIVEIANQCIKTLIDSELNICNFYFQRGQIKQTKKRLAMLKNTWLARYPLLEDDLTAFEEKIIAYQNALDAKATKNTRLACNKKEKKMTERF